MNSEGHITVIYGPMFSGKSSELLRKIRRYEHAKKSCLIINYLHDNRYSGEDCMATHDKYFYILFQSHQESSKNFIA
jgi:thymidine kinase